MQCSCGEQESIIFVGLGSITDHLVSKFTKMNPKIRVCYMSLLGEVQIQRNNAPKGE